MTAQHRTLGASDPSTGLVVLERPAPPAPPAPGPRAHVARKPGTCRSCGRPYASGDTLLILEREPHHPACLAPSAARAPAPAVSPAPPPAPTTTAEVQSDRVLVACPRRGQRGGEEELRIVLGTYEGHAFLGLRVWFRTGAVWRPTKRGLTIRPRELGAVIGALTEAAATLGVDADPPPRAVSDTRRNER